MTVTKKNVRESFLCKKSDDSYKNRESFSPKKNFFFPSDDSYTPKI